MYGDFRDAGPEVDVPFAQSLSPNVTIGVRTAEEGAMTKTIAAAVHSVDPQIALARPRTMDQVKAPVRSPRTDTRWSCSPASRP